MKIIVEVGLLLAFFSIQGSAIQCYQCQYVSTAPDNTCYGPSVGDQHLSSCPTGQDYCLTSVAKASASGIDVTTILRQCSPVTAQYNCQTIAGVNACLDYCSGDGCNSGNGNSGNGNSGNGNSGSLVQASLFTLMLAMVGALALIKW
ncbi:unnamed protein product [Clavelina lepadiformis]|uniref:UPAR/Ly6 domain-containing protein n=1 Tax=Clavelina lepadiformis TaxID=159417 RepID=A0ABP0FJA7_CLALP